MPQITLEMLERWLNGFEGKATAHYHNFYSKEGLEGAIERGEYPEIAEMRQVIAEMKGKVKP